MKYRYKLKVTEVDGEIMYTPLCKRFLFWRKLAFGTDYNRLPLYIVETTYEKAMEAINTHKKFAHVPKRKRLTDIEIK